MRRLEIAVAGCGPCGLAAALLLARDGHRVRLFERFDEPRPVGSGLLVQPTGRAVLKALGLEGRLLDHGARVDRLFGRSMPSGRIALQVRYDWLKGGHFGVGIHRAALFDILFREVQAAAIAIETSRTVIGSEEEAGCRRLRLANGRSARFDLVVDCLGAGSPLPPACGGALPYGALWTSLDWPDQLELDGCTLEQRYVRAGIMAGVLPIGRRPGSSSDQAAFFWSMRAKDEARWRERGLAAWKTEVLALWPDVRSLLDRVVSLDQLTFARYAHRTLSWPVGRALIHLGDAWHSTSPQLGQGANMALLDAWALATALREKDDLADALALAAQLRRRHVLLFQLLSWLFTPVYQSDGRLLPLVRDRIVGPLSKIEPAKTIQAAMVTGLFGRPLARLSL